ncbi:MAG: hypothetical protein JSV94_00845 [Methanobacteriota archaeon]|nr:MAG: hypothetical protein JSV94_00845 [Euryarchaeota archaeon]
MNIDSLNEQRPSGSRWVVAVSVIVGISLFVAGFALTLSALRGEAVAGIDGTNGVDVNSNNIKDLSGEGFPLVIGLTLSMIGVVVATVVPASAFIKRVDHDA